MMDSKLKKEIDNEFSSLNSQIQVALVSQINDIKTENEYISLFNDCYNTIDELENRYVHYLNDKEAKQYVSLKASNARARCQM